VWSSTSAIFGWPNGKRRNEVRTRRGVTEFAKLAKAISTFRRALEIDPRSPAAHLALGDALLRAGQAAPAVTELKAAAALSPGMRQVYTLLARRVPEARANGGSAPRSPDRAGIGAGRDQVARNEPEFGGTLSCAP
jgi:tetratricopeptide (TPR) repeat protein